jgi:hypothetical protein
VNDVGSWPSLTAAANSRLWVYLLLPKLNEKYSFSTTTTTATATATINKHQRGLLKIVASNSGTSPTYKSGYDYLGGLASDHHYMP